MSKYLCWGSLGTAGLLLVLFVCDMIIGKPFNGLSLTVDILGAMSSGVVGYLAWDASREIR